MTTNPYSRQEWAYEYNPYTGQDGREIPAFTVNDADCNRILDTNEDLPEEKQEAIARLASLAPELLAALTDFFNIMHDYESSLEKGYIEHEMQRAKVLIDRAAGRAA